MSVKQFAQSLNKRDNELQDTLKCNPYSDSYLVQKHDKAQDGYGRPTPGSKTERRGIKAGVYVCREITFLCETISKFGDQIPGQPEGVVQIKFGKLFDIYSYYSDKCTLISLMAVIIRNFPPIYRPRLSVNASSPVRIHSKIFKKCMLLRARKYKLVDFEGEMLYQRQDDEKIVTLLMPISEIKARMKESNDPVNCVQISNGN